MNRQLRERLYEITLDPNVESHAAQIENLRAEIPHTISVCGSPTPISRYTCAVYAFGLVEDPNYLEIASFGSGATFAGKAFVDYLLQNGLLMEKVPASVNAGDVVLYFRESEFTHIGRIRSPARVMSKWGSGLLYEHAMWEVPADYGEEIRYFEGPNDDESFALFIGYAKSRGFRFG